MVATIDTVNANIDTAFVAGAVATITLTAPVNGAVADGADTNQVDALVEDANGNPITGAAVVFSSANGVNTGVKWSGINAPDSYRGRDQQCGRHR